MQVEGIIPAQNVTCDFATGDPAEAVRLFRAKYPDARIEQIDGEFVRGLCEVCGKPIFENDRCYSYDSESVLYLCDVHTETPPRGLERTNTP